MTTPTALSIFTDALNLLGVYGPGEQIDGADGDTGLSVLNDLLDNWSNLTLACFYIQQISFPLVPMQNQYTIGIGGQIDVQRPLKLISGPGCAYVIDTNGNKYGVSVVPLDQWNMIGNNSSLVTSDFPDTVFYDPQFPLGIVNVCPFPTIAYTMFLTPTQKLENLSTLYSSLELPPGYKRAIVTNLAVMLKPYYSTAQIDPLVVAEALKTLGDIKRKNMRR